MLLSKYDLLLADRMTYLEQKYTRHLNHADIDYDNITMTYQSINILTIFFFGYSFLILPSSFMISGVKSSVSTKS